MAQIIIQLQSQFNSLVQFGAKVWRSVQGKGCGGRLVVLLGVCSVALPLNLISSEGLIWDETDLAVWRNRAEHGPYKTAGDGFDQNIPAEWGRITANKDAFMAAPADDRIGSYSVRPNGDDPLTEHMTMVDAAFYSLIAGDDSIAEMVKRELMWHATNSAMQIDPSTYLNTDIGNWWRAEWLRRLVFCADYVKHVFSPSELVTFNGWIEDWAYAYEGSIHKELSSLFWGNRYSRDYKNNLGWGASSDPNNVSEYAYKDANGRLRHPLHMQNRAINNRKASAFGFYSLASVWLDDPILIDRSKLFVEEMLKFWLYPDGAFAEFNRNGDSGRVNSSGLTYGAVNVSMGVTFAYALANNGDPSMFNYTTRDGYDTSKSTGSDPDKSLKLAVESILDLAEGKKEWYWHGASVLDEDSRIKTINEQNGKQWLLDVATAPLGNRYWKDARIRDGYMRVLDGSLAYPSSSGLQPSGPYGPHWRGCVGEFPSMLFMFAEDPDSGEAPDGGSATDGSVTDGSVTDGSVTDGSVTDGSVTDGSTGEDEGLDVALPLNLISSEGLIWDETDLAVWRNRAEHGPYKTAGDGFDQNIPAEWGRITANKDAFMAAPADDRIGSYSVRPNGDDPLTEHMTMVDAAFYSLIAGDDSIAEMVKRELMWHATNSAMQIDPSTYLNTDIGNWWRAEWLRRLVFCADYVKHVFSPSELVTFNGWIEDWAYAYEGSIHKELSSLFWGNRYSRDYKNNLGWGASSDPNNVSEYAYKDANGRLRHPLHMQNRAINNRKASAFGFYSLASVWLDDPILIDRSKLFVEEMLKFWLYPDGAFAEFNRNGDSGRVNSSGLTYGAVNVSMGVTFAYALANNGDPSMFNYTTRDGYDTSKSTGSDPDKSLKLAVESILDLAEGKKEWYWHGASVLDEDSRIKTINEQNGKQWLLDVATAPLGNRYWKDARIRDGYMRVLDGSLAYPSSSGLQPSGPYGPHWRGCVGEFPSMLFMFAEDPDSGEAPDGGSATDGSVTDGSVTDGSVTDGSVTDGSVTDGSTGEDEGLDVALPLNLISSEGLIWDETDLAVWRNRAEHGPYKTAGDGFDQNIPAEWGRITANKDAFMAAPADDRIGSYSVRPNGDDPLTEHMTMVDAAFYSLIAGDDSIAEMVKRELMWHATNSAMQIDPSTYLNTDIGNWWRAEWLRRLVFCADYVKHVFSPSELVTFNGWIEDWAYAYEGSIHKELSSLFWGNRYSRDYKNNLGWGASSDPNNVSEYAYKDANGRLRHPLHMQNRAINNRKASAFGFYSLASVWLDDPILIDRSKLFVEEMLKFWLYPDGAFAEFNRNGDSGRVNSSGLTYGAVNVSMGVTFAYALANNGDPSMFNYTTRDGYDTSKSTGSDPDKSLKLAVESILDLAEGKKEWYWHGASVLDEDSRIKTINEQNGKQWLLDVATAPLGNRYWKDARIRDGYMRVLDGSLAYPSSSGLQPSGPYGPHWRGCVGEFPSMLFMFAEDPDSGEAPDGGSATDGSATDGSAGEVTTDRLPDDWEIQNFGGVNAEFGGEDEDFDGDGLSNYAEWKAGTDPTDAADFLSLEPILGVSWHSRQDRSYQIEYTDDNWKSTKVSEIINGIGGGMFWVDPTARDVSHNRQYRIFVVQN